jgi:hypothetical protein
MTTKTEKTALTSAMIEIQGPQDGNFIVHFTAADGRSLAILVPADQASVLRDIQESMPYGVAVNDVVAVEAEVE